MFTMQMDTIDKLLGDIGRLQEGYKLLEEVYLEHGPYGQDPIPDDLRYKINNFFGFDDSE
jgi:hypothetical protein